MVLESAKFITGISTRRASAIPRKDAVSKLNLEERDGQRNGHREVRGHDRGGYAIRVTGCVTPCQGSCARAIEQDVARNAAASVDDAV